MELTSQGPDELVATDRRLHRFSFTLTDDASLEAGSAVRVLLAGYRTMWEGDWRLTQARLVAGEGAVETTLTPPRHRLTDVVRAGRQQHVMVEVTVRSELVGPWRLTIALEGTAALHAGLDPVFTVTARRGGQPLVQAAGQTPALPDGLEPAGHWSVVGGPMRTPLLPGPAVSMEARLRVDPARPDQADVTIFAVDALRNIARGGGLALGLGASRGVTGMPESAALPAGAEPLRLDGLTLEPGGPHRVSVALPPDDGDASGEPRTLESNPVFNGPLEGWRHFFGDPHFHTGCSADGDGDLDAALAYARDVLRLDVACVTEHTPRRDWDKILARADAWTRADRFIVLPAWEWSDVGGHVCVYLKSPEVDAGPAQWSPGQHPGRRAWPRDAILAPHHTNMRSRERRPDGSRFWRTFDFSARNDRYRAFEIVQSRGVFETDLPDATWGVVSGGRGASYRDVLAQGFRLGVVGGSDNHAGRPTRHATEPGQYAGLTGFLASSLTRDAIWSAMDQRRTWATTGAPIVLRLAVCNAVMGSETRQPAGSPLVVDARLHGTASIERVELICNGRVVWAGSPGRPDVRLSRIELLPSGDVSEYVYLRARQSDGHRVWSSPVWIDRLG